MTQADDLLRQGKYHLALPIYQHLQPEPALVEALQYRTALCREGLGRWDEALSDFREVASRSTTSCLSWSAQLSQARVWLRLRKSVEARNLLSNLILKSAEPALPDQRFLAEARYLMAFTLTLEAWNPDKPGPDDDFVVGHAAGNWPVERALDWLTWAKEPEQPAGQAVADAVVVNRGGPGVEEALVRATVRQMATSEFVERLAQQSHMQVNWTTHARQQIAERSVAVTVADLPLPDLLNAIADPPGLVWKIGDGVIAFSAEQDLSKKELAEYRTMMAKRSLRAAILAYPGHALTPAAYLNCGNLEFASGSLNDALGWYERLVRELPQSPVVVEANYNRGLTYQLLKDLAPARSSFYQVVDRAPGHELAPLAYLRIGRMSLNEGDPEHAVPPLRRALSLAPGSAGEPAAAVALATAYLLTDNPRAANAVLVEHRESVGQEPYRRVAAFLDALARFRAVPDPNEARREASTLLAAALSAREDPLLDPSGRLLLGHAFQEIGLSEQMATIYEKALRNARGPLAAEMSYTLAQSLYLAENREPALQLFTSLAATDNDKWAPQSSGSTGGDRLAGRTLAGLSQLVPQTSQAKEPGGRTGSVADDGAGLRATRRTSPGGTLLRGANAGVVDS